MQNLLDKKVASVKRRMMGDSKEDHNPKSSKSSRRGSKKKSIPLPNPDTILDAIGKPEAKEMLGLNPEAGTSSQEEKGPPEAENSLDKKNPLPATSSRKEEESPDIEVVDIVDSNLDKEDYSILDDNDKMSTEEPTKPSGPSSADNNDDMKHVEDEHKGPKRAFEDPSPSNKKPKFSENFGEKQMERNPNEASHANVVIKGLTAIKIFKTGFTTASGYMTVTKRAI